MKCKMTMVHRGAPCLLKDSGEMLFPAIEGAPNLGHVARPVVDGRYAGDRAGNGAGNCGTSHGATIAVAKR